MSAAYVTTDDIAQIISSMTGIDVGSVTEEDRQKLLGLEDGIHREEYIFACFVVLSFSFYRLYCQV